MTVDPSAAFALFFKNHTGPVFRALLAGTLNRAAAEDATAEAFARAFAHWDTIAVHPNPRAWVLRVAWNCYRSSWRKWESRWSADQPEVPPLAPEPWSDPDLVAALRTFVSAIESLPNFRGPVEALGGWLFQIARHDLYDHRRKQSRSRTEPLEDQLTHPALNRLSPREREVLASFALEYELTADPDGRQPLAMETLEEADVMAALQQLSLDQREVLLLSMVAGLTVPEVATVLGRAVNAVKALRHRGLQQTLPGPGPTSPARDARTPVTPQPRPACKARQPRVHSLRVKSLSLES